MNLFILVLCFLFSIWFLEDDLFKIYEDPITYEIDTLREFKNKLGQNKTVIHSSPKSTPYLCSWLHTGKAMVLILSDNTLQVYYRSFPIKKKKNFNYFYAVIDQFCE